MNRKEKQQGVMFKILVVFPAVIFMFYIFVSVLVFYFDYNKASNLLDVYSKSQADRSYDKNDLIDGLLKVLKSNDIDNIDREDIIVVINNRAIGERNYTFKVRYLRSVDMFLSLKLVFDQTKEIQISRPQE